MAKEDERIETWICNACFNGFPPCQKIFATENPKKIIPKACIFHGTGWGQKTKPNWILERVEYVVFDWNGGIEKSLGIDVLYELQKE